MPKPKTRSPSPKDHSRGQQSATGGSVSGSGTEKELAATQGLPDDRPSSPGGLGSEEIIAKVKELVRLAQEQGYLTFGDINDSLPDSLISAEDLDDIITKLRGLEVEIVDQAEVDCIKQPEPEMEEETNRLDILDDPVRMYLRQMGRVPLLTREQEVEISKRIEEAEAEVHRLVYSFGFAAKEHMAVAEKLISDPPKERFDRVIVDNKVEGREKHLRTLSKLLKTVGVLDAQVQQAYAAITGTMDTTEKEARLADFTRLHRKLQNTFPKFFYKQKVVEEMTLVAENIHDKFQSCLRLTRELEQ
jgi:RNA polymerase primary sigma factor